MGIVVCDTNFALIETYSSLIKPAENSNEEALAAFRVHGITPGVLETAQQRKDAASDLHRLALKHTIGKNKPVLVSDNAQFEYAFTKVLLGEYAWPFHYCVWDTSLFLEATGVGDPVPAHRALRDAGLLHAAILRALQKTHEQ